MSGELQEQRADRWRMNDLREMIGMHVSITGKIIRSGMMWAGHVVRTEEGRLRKKEEATKQPGRRMKLR